jgi:hypothetical protein
LLSDVDCYLPLAEAIQLNPRSQFKHATVCAKFGGAVIWRWRCLAAHQNDHAAQNHVGHYYRVGSRPVQQDLVEAHKWYSLAMTNGNNRAAALLHDISEQMTPAQIAEAERLVAEWQPNPAECEINSGEVHAP